MGDQTLLAKIALTDKDSGVRTSAAFNLTSMIGNGKAYPLLVTDQARLEQLAEHLQFVTPNGVSDQAVEKLTDPGALARVALNASDGHVRQLAVGKLTDSEVLARVALNDSDGHVRQFAEQRLPDDVLARVVAAQPKEVGEDFEKAMKESTVESLSGFLKQHPYSIQETEVLSGIWTMLFAEYLYGCNTSFDRFKVELPEAIAGGGAFVVACIRDRNLTVEFWELAGHPAEIDSAVPTFETTGGVLNPGPLLISPRQHFFPVNLSIPAYGRGRYVYSGPVPFGWGGGAGDSWGIQFHTPDGKDLYVSYKP